jgi:hypothetical protein
MQGPSALPNYGFRAGCPQQPAEVLGVAGYDYVAIVGQECDVSVDNVARSGGATKLADTSGYLRVETVLKDTAKQAGQVRLPWSTSSPDLGHTPRRGRDPLAAAAGDFDQSRDLAIATVEGDQTARVEYQAHA